MKIRSVHVRNQHLYATHSGKADFVKHNNSLSLFQMPTIGAHTFQQNVKGSCPEAFWGAAQELCILPSSGGWDERVIPVSCLLTTTC